jgi:ubiquinone/menaquinone biosynthesis C-methylase UbiE
MSKFTTSETDKKSKWGGILEWPLLSKVHRNSLDGQKAAHLIQIIKPFVFNDLLEVGCGLGDYSVVRKGHYTGLDNSFHYVRFASRRYKDCAFVFGDAGQLPFRDNSYDAVLFACTAHHFSDASFLKALQEMQRVSRKYIIIDDQVQWAQQGRLSRFFYDLDRGTNNRTLQDFEQLIARQKGLKILQKARYKSFPGLYLHGVFVIAAGQET